MPENLWSETGDAGTKPGKTHMETSESRVDTKYIEGGFRPVPDPMKVSVLVNAVCSPHNLICKCGAIPQLHNFVCSSGSEFDVNASLNLCESKMRELECPNFQVSITAAKDSWCTKIKRPWRLA